MQISGFQKLTLLDFPGKVACIVFTARCNFRCPFCHNASLVTHIDAAARVEEAEVLAYLQKRKGLIDGVVVTGGEPLLQPDLADFLRRVKAFGLSVKLDTNGSFPDRLAALVEEGLVDYVAMDVKNSKEHYAATAGVSAPPLADIEQSIALLKSGTVDGEFRTTVVGGLHTEADIHDIAVWLAGAPRWFLQNFVDSGDLIGQGLAAVPSEELQKMLGIARQNGLNAAVRGEN